MERINKHKYLIVSTIFVAWLLFFDASSISSWVGTKSENASIKKEKEFYDKEFLNVERLLLDMKTNNDSLEYYARESFFMKKDNEVIYIIE